MMIRRVAGKTREVVRILRSAEPTHPGMRVVEGLMAKHVKKRDHANHRPKKVRRLRQSGSDKQARIGPAKDGQLLWCRTPGFNEPLGGCHKIIDCDLAVSPFGGVVPPHSEF